jgi:hypothetical protein
MMWTRGSIVASLLIVLIIPLLSFNARVDGQEEQDGKRNPLRLTVTVLAQTYCVNRTIVDAPVRGAVVGEVSFDLHLRIQNVGGYAIILCKKCIESDPPNLFDVRPDGTKGSLSWGVIPDTLGVIVHAHHPQRPDLNYPIVPPGGVLEVDRAAGVSFVLFSGYLTPSKGYWVNPGRYFLQARFVTWPSADSEALVLARRWKSYGELYDQEIVAEPIPIQIEVPKAPPDCPAR